MAAQFQISQHAVSWLTLVFSLVPCCTLLIFGYLGDTYGYKRQFLIGFLFFGAISLLTPFLAAGLRMLIFMRCLQGIGYSILISITQAILSKTFEAHERGKALGINSVFVSVGMASGPTIGGLLLEYFDWQAIFLFNVPFCIVGFLITWVVLNDDTKRAARRKNDWAGSALFAFAIGLLIVGLNFSNDWGWLSGRFLLCVISSVCSLILFIRHENRTENPLMQMRLFKNRTFSLANGACVCNYLTQQMTTFLVPFFLMDILGVRSHHAGLIMLASPAAMMVSSPFGGDMTDKYGARPPAILGLSMIVLGCVVMSMLTESSGMLSVAATLLLFGAGNGFSVSAINTSVLSAVPPAHAGVASGIVATMRNLGQTLGVACGSVIIAMQQSAYQAGTALTAKGVYLKAERDAFYFGIAVTVAALLMICKIPGDKNT